MLQNETINEIYLPKGLHNKIIEHCLRKLNRQYLAEETAEQQAYGLIGGKLSKSVLSVGIVIPLCNNFRNDISVKETMDSNVKKYAIPAKTPVEERGWVANPHETMKALELFQQNDFELIGAYHMHHLGSWKGDSLRDEPTYFDRVLAKNTQLIMFIVSLANLKKPILRAFYEGKVEKEIEIRSI